MKRYVGVIYFRNGTTQRTGSCDSRMAAERLAIQYYEQAMRTAVSDFFKPTRYEVQEV